MFQHGNNDRDSLEAQLILLQGELEDQGENWTGDHETLKLIEVVQERLRDLQRAEDLATDPEDLEEEGAYLRREIAELASHGGPDSSEAMLWLTDRSDEIENALVAMDEDADPDSQ